MDKIPRMRDALGGIWEPRDAVDGREQDGTTRLSHRRRAIGAGVHAIVATERRRVLRLTRGAETMAIRGVWQMAGRAVLIGGVGRSVPIQRLAKARRQRVRRVLVPAPDPSSRRAGIAYASASPMGAGLPLMLYLRNDAIGLDAIEKLCRVPGVAGVKWACPTPMRLAEAIRRCDPDIVWVDGLAEPWAPPFLAVGARGFTSGLINVWPEHSVAIHAALEKRLHKAGNSSTSWRVRGSHGEEIGTKRHLWKAALHLSR